MPLPGDPTEPRVPPLTQLPSAARERVVAALARRYADDELSDAQLQARLDRVYAATTPAELDAVLADLPAVSAGTGVAAPADVAGVRQVKALLSGQEQRLSGVVPRRLELRVRLGYVELDLTRATFEPGVSEIDVRSIGGYVQIWLPPGVRVESHGRALFGFFSLHGSTGGSAESAPLVRITGRAMFGFAECFLASRQPPPLPPGTVTRIEGS